MKLLRELMEKETASTIAKYLRDVDVQLIPDNIIIQPRDVPAKMVKRVNDELAQDYDKEEVIFDAAIDFKLIPQPEG